MHIDPRGRALDRIDKTLREAPVAPIAFVTWPERRIANLSSLIDALAARIGPTDRGAAGLRVGEALAVVGRRAYGPILLAIGLFSISPISLIPGTTWAFALATLLVAAQMFVGLKRPWLPRRVLDLPIPAGIMRRSLEAARPWARRVDRFLNPRLSFLTMPPFANAVALACMIAALITFPLGFVPLAPAAPSLAIILFGLGITARDGLLLGLGTAALTAGLWFAVQAVA